MASRSGGTERPEKLTIDARRAAIRTKIQAIEHELLTWERARVAAQTDAERLAAAAQLVVLRGRWERQVEALERLRDQLTLPWFGGKGGRRAS